MIIDTSAIIAIAKREPAAGRLVDALVSADAVGIAAASWFEASMVLGGTSFDNPQKFLADFGREFRIESITFGAEHAREARDAWYRYGKGNHPARLNFGDCIAYATAKIASTPLLFVGDDFAQTDVMSALR